MKNQNEARRTVIVGLDGMPYGLMRTFGQDGTMPNFGRLTREGVFHQMASSIPEVSSVAWSSIITGVNPGRHGVFGFTDVAPATYRMTFPNFNDLKVEPFWEQEGRGRSVIINVPSTFPAREMDGVHIAGFVALDLERATYPDSLVTVLRDVDYRVDVDSRKAHQALGFFLRDLDKTLEARVTLCRHLWHQEDWRTFMLVFTGTDRLAHFLWDARENEAHEYHEAFVRHFQEIDRVIGEIVQRMRDDDVLILLSDHGFEDLKLNVQVNRLLQDAGFLSFEDGATPGLKTMTDDTRAFALDPGRIYVHARDRFPGGRVRAQDRQLVRQDIVDLFEPIQVGEERVIRRIYHREELYSGPELHRAPDLVLLGSAGHNLRANWKTGKAFGTDIFVGKHSQRDAFLLVRGKGATRVVPKKPSVTDIVDIIDAMRSV